MGKKVATEKQAPDLSQLREKLAAAVERRDELRLKADRIMGQISASREPRVGLASLVADDLASVQALASVEAEVDELQTEIEAGELAERERRREQLAARRGPILKRLAMALDQAAEVNAELMEIEGGMDPSAQRLAWPELAAETPLMGGRIAGWRRFCAAERYEV